MLAYRVKLGEKLRLKDIDASERGPFAEKDDPAVTACMRELDQRLNALQEAAVGAGWSRSMKTCPSRTAVL